MGRAITVSTQGQPEVVIDLDRLAMVEFSQTARQMLVRYNDGDARRYESQDVPFDVERIARQIQVNAKGFEVCDRAAIVGLSGVKYAITETPDQQGQGVLSLGVEGHKRVDVIVSATAADNIVARMNRERPTLNCQLARGQKIHMYPAALMLAEYKNGREMVTLDFATAGKIDIKPIATKHGFLTAQWTSALAGIFPAQEAGLCAGVIERIGFQHEGLQFIKHVNGVAVAARAAVQSVVARDYPDELPGVTINLARGDRHETVSFDFATDGARDDAATAVAPIKRAPLSQMLTR